VKAYQHIIIEGEIMCGKKCPEEPNKKYEESICATMEKLANLLCEQLPDQKDFCKKLVKDIVEFKISGEEAAKLLEERVGRERFMEARKRVQRLLLEGRKT